MERYKIGDKVRVVKEREDVDEPNQKGKLAEVVDNEGDAGVVIKFIGIRFIHWYYTFDEIELVSSLPDKVNPPHYKKGSVECIDAIKAATVGKSGFEGYMVGNIIKYVFRYEDKGGVEDLKKASWYLNKLIDERST